MESKPQQFYAIKSLKRNFRNDKTNSHISFESKTITFRQKYTKYSNRISIKFNFNLYKRALQESLCFQNSTKFINLSKYIILQIQVYLLNYAFDLLLASIYLTYNRVRRGTLGTQCSVTKILTHCLAQLHFFILL